MKEKIKDSEASIDIEKLNILKDLLSDSKVCRPNPVVHPDQVCSMALAAGYADIVTNREVFRLGAQVENSCGKNDLVDLCDQRGVHLQVWFNEIKTNLSNYTCAP